MKHRHFQSTFIRDADDCVSTFRSGERDLVQVQIVNRSLICLPEREYAVCPIRIDGFYRAPVNGAVVNNRIDLIIDAAKSLVKVDVSVNIFRSYTGICLSVSFVDGAKNNSSVFGFLNVTVFCQSSCNKAVFVLRDVSCADIADVGISSDGNRSDLMISGSAGQVTFEVPLPEICVVFCNVGQRIISSLYFGISSLYFSISSLYFSISSLYFGISSLYFGRCIRRCTDNALRWICSICKYRKRHAPRNCNDCGHSCCSDECGRALAACGWCTH